MRRSYRTVMIAIGLLPWACTSEPPAGQTVPANSAGTDASAQTPLYINIQVDAETDDVQGLTNIVEALKERDLRTTLFVTADYANKQAVLVRTFYQQGFEIGLHGYYTGEQLGTMTYDEQKDLLTRAKQAVEGCRPCGTYKPVTSFRPQYFSQNEDTYRVLDELGLASDSGFKAGVLFAEGHDTDVAPYLMPDHEFYAVPIATVDREGKELYVCDVAAVQSENLTGQQWGELLQAALDQAVQQGGPLVVLVHGYITGDQTQYDYWQPFVDFLDQAKAKGTIVTTTQLVDHYKGS
jgi:peptidoglycan/xylan/chitin deacetylase (PgdA/CDA1 family)